MPSPAEKGFGQSDVALGRWAEEVFSPTDEVLDEVRRRAREAGLPSIHVGPMDGLHLEVIARAMGARQAVEIGTLAGLSGICLLRGMGPEGRLHTFENEPRHAALAEKLFERAGLAGQVTIHLGPALRELRRVEGQGPFDLVFIDADKGGYPAYLSWAEEHLRVGGVVLADNAFAFGHVHEPSHVGPDAAAVEPLRRFSERLARGGRFRATMLPTAEGLAMGVKVR
ncbi:MAG TPA: O-methyltransferase [Anaeromyxobacteraceae bacterium]|nr:O-methyltransferase [Anaeromyxobacteraceae bacterium]